MMTDPIYIGRRIFAGLLDYTLIVGFTYAYIIHYGEPNDDGSYSVTGLPGLVPPLLWFTMTVLTEQFLGATIGNGIVGLKPVSDNEIKSKPTIAQSFKRHLPDIADMFFFGLVGILLIKNTPKRQRLGDLLAKTIVVRDFDKNP